MNEVEEVKNRLDIVDLVSQYVTLKKAGANYKGSCPFHQEKTASLMVSPQKQIWKCFGCGKGGDQFSFVMEAEHLEFGDALRLLAQKAGVTLQPRTQAEHQTHGRKELLYRINNLASLVFQRFLLSSNDGKAALTYLKKRGLNDETINKFRLGFAPSNYNLRSVMAKHNVTASDLGQAGSPEKFYERIMFPIFDVIGNVIAFTGRALGDAQPKYLNSPETPLYNKSRVLYGLNFAKIGIKEKNYVVLVEGQMDVVALHQYGFTQAVASSGTAITEAQLLILSKYTDNFLLAFDIDAAGITTTKKVIELLLKNDLNAKVVDFAPYKDAGELLEKEPDGWPGRVKAAKEAVEWFLQQEIVRIGAPQFVENKKALVKAVLPLLMLVNEPTRLDYYIQRLSRAIEAKPESLYASLKKYSAEQKPTTPLAAAPKPVPTTLTNEEQLLAILLFQPTLLDTYFPQFDQIVWLSSEAERIAVAIKSCYNKKTLVKNQNQFLSGVKTALHSQLDEKIDSWLFWLSTSWPEFGPELGSELATEKIGQLATKSYEQNKEKLATAIRAAQEAGDQTEMKRLMKELNNITKEGNRD